MLTNIIIEYLEKLQNFCATLKWTLEFQPEYLNELKLGEPGVRCYGRSFFYITPLSLAHPKPVNGVAEEMGFDEEAAALATFINTVQVPELTNEIWASFKN